MEGRESREQRLSDLRGAEEEWRQACLARAEAGEAVFRSDATRLARLAAELAANVRAWAVALAALELGGAHALDVERAGRQVMETVFEDALDPCAWSLMRAALALA